MDNGRRSDRLELAFPVLVESAGQVRRQTAVNVSEAGLLFVSREPYPEGAVLRVTFGLPLTDVEILAEAIVRHVAWSSDEPGFRIGVEFVRFEEGELHPPLRCLPS